MQFSPYYAFLYEFLEKRDPEYPNLLTNIEAIFCNLLKTLSKLLEIDVHHSNINPSHIVVTVNPIDLKLFSPIIPESYNIYMDLDRECRLYAEEHINNESNIYSSPELLNLKSQAIKNQDYDQEKSDIYSLGACILKIFLIDEHST